MHTVIHAQRREQNEVSVTQAQGTTTATTTSKLSDVLGCMPEHAAFCCRWRGLVWLSTCYTKRGVDTSSSNREGYDGRAAAFCLVSLILDFTDDTGDLPPILRNRASGEGQNACRFEPVIRLLLTGKELEANSLLEEFDEPPLWDDLSLDKPWERLHTMASAGWLGAARHHDDLPQCDRDFVTLRWQQTYETSRL